MSIHKLAFGFCSIFMSCSLAFAQPPGGGLDKVFYLEKKTGKILSSEGTIKESAAGIVVSANGKEKSKHLPSEIVRVEFGDTPGLTPDDKSSLFTLENEKDLEKAARGFAALSKKVTNDRAKRAYELRELQLLVKSAESKDEGTYKTVASGLVGRIAGFSKSSSKSWEFWPAGKLATRIYTDLGQSVKAAEIYTGLANTADVPSELKAEAKIFAADALLKSNFANGKDAVAKLLSDKDIPTAGTLREKLAIYDLWAKAEAPVAGTAPADALKKIQASIDASKDNTTRAAGFNAKGELLFAVGLYRESMWEFLNVEVVYNQDKEEVAKAMQRLAELFDKFGEKERSDSYREKLRKIRS